MEAHYAHRYSLTRAGLACILDMFPIVRRKDETQCGEYRTKWMVFEKCKELEARMG
jgi:hypothetical protein